MASFTHFFIMFLVISGTCVVEGGRCDDMLSQTGCDLSVCRPQCYAKHNSTNDATSASCVEDPNHAGVYACHCYYNC
ncbi:hypothetical protein M5689_018672 [Euphorbia peplus]|nr:hypothetical protein M5689_018672 [Euphorbia peplus]